MDQNRNFHINATGHKWKSHGRASGVGVTDCNERSILDKHDGSDVYA